MTVIEFDDTTAQALAEAAKSHGMTVQEFVRSQVLREPNNTQTAEAASRVDFDFELDGLLFSGPVLPADFSRADIYLDRE